MRLSTTILCCLLMTCAAVAQRPDRPRRGEAPPPVELKNFTFSEQKLDSPAVGQQMPFGVYLPVGYEDPANKDKQYPLVIWLHGMYEDHMRFHGRGGAPLLDKAADDGSLPPCVFVLVNAGRTSMYVNREKQKWEDLVTVDLLAHVEKNYRVSKERKSRALMGISMGGMAALRIGMQQPALFGTVAVHSSAVFPEDPDKLPDRMKQAVARLGLAEVFGDPIDKQVWRKANPLCIAADLDPKTLDGLRIYFDAGTDDRYHFADGNAQLHAALDKKKIDHQWTLVQGGGHSWGSGLKDDSLLASLAFVGEGFKTADAVNKGQAGLKGLLGGDKGGSGK